MLTIDKEKNQSKQQALFGKSGELGKLLNAVDWSNNPLGPVENWPASLQSAVSICLGSRFPIALICGSKSVLIYNQAYMPLLGIKHPTAIAVPLSLVWPEIWDIVEPMLEGVRRTGEATWSEDLLLIIDRFGVMEENYFTFSYSAIGMNEGDISSVFASVLHTTENVLNKRRMITLRNLGTCLTGLDSVEVLCSLMMAELAKNNADVPFSLVYLIDRARQEASLAGTAGLNDHESLAPSIYHLQVVTEDKSVENSLWPLSEVAATGKFKIIDVTHLPNLPKGQWAASPKQVILLPITTPDHDLPTGILVMAVSPVRALDEAYLDFYHTAATHLALAIAKTQAYEQQCKRAEALAEIDRSKTLFFSNISHEFRTPLTLILGPLEDALSDQEQPPRQREALVLVQRNALRLLKLVNTLLDFSRLEAGRTKAFYQPLPLDTLTAELIGVFRSAIEKAGLVLEVEIEAFEEPVYVDWDMWEKIVFNLLSNALKYTQKGSIHVTFKKSAQHMEFSVIDTGVGIPEAELPKIFQRFYRVEDVHGRSFEGTGIGLSLIEELVKMHGGNIRVISKPSEGSVFTVSIPRGFSHLPTDQLKESAKPVTSDFNRKTFVDEAMRWLSVPEHKSVTNRSQEDKENSLKLEVKQEALINSQNIAGFKEEIDAPSSSPKVSPIKPCIVLADDNADMRDYVTRLLENDYQIIAVTDGEAALEAVQIYKPQLILSDVMMPKLDGFGLIRALQSNPATQKLPIILLSARAGEAAKVEGLQRGADDYLVKPFSAKELLARIKIHLELSKLRLHMKEVVEKSSQELQILTKISPVGIYYVDIEGRLTYINEKGCQILGLSFEKAKGYGWEQALHPEDKDRVLSLYPKNPENTDNHFKSEYRYLHSNKAVIEVVAEVAPEKDNNGKIIGYMGTLTDITELRALERAHFEVVRSNEEQQRKRAEDAEKHRTSLEVFVDTMCHELRNPLNGIYGNVNLLKTSSSTLKSELQTANPVEIKETVLKHLQEDEDALTSIEKCVRYQKVITDDVLSLSKLEAGKLELNYVDFKPNQLVNDILKMVEKQATDKLIRFHFDLLPTDMLIQADPNRITQVLLNLLTNAIKFSPQESGEISICLKLLPDDSGKTFLQITVKDNGIGMTEEEQSRLFDRFSQASRSTSAEYGGSGLGLAISKNLVSLMGGKICMESTKGQGTKINFTFQYLPSTDLELIAHNKIVSPPTNLSTLSIKGRRILIVEDNVINQKILLKQLTQAGCQCHVANNGQEAIDIFNKFPFDLIFMDIEMPVLNGLEATKAIRKKEHELGRDPSLLIPIIGLSGNARSEQKTTALNCGMDDYLLKPYEKAKLLSTIIHFVKSDKPFSSSPPFTAREVKKSPSPSEQKEVTFLPVISATTILSDFKKSESASPNQAAFFSTPTKEPISSVASLLLCADEILSELKRIFPTLEGTQNYWKYREIDNTFNLVAKGEDSCHLKAICQHFKKNRLNNLKLTQNQILYTFEESEIGISTTLELRVENLIQLKSIPVMFTLDSFIELPNQNSTLFIPSQTSASSSSSSPSSASFFSPHPPILTIHTPSVENQPSASAPASHAEYKSVAPVLNKKQKLDARKAQFQFGIVKDLLDEIYPTEADKYVEERTHWLNRLLTYQERIGSLTSGDQQELIKLEERLTEIESVLTTASIGSIGNFQ